MTYQIITSHQESDIQNCRMSKLDGTSLVMCQMGITACQWVTHFGYARFCNHPSAKQVSMTPNMSVKLDAENRLLSGA